MSRIGQFLRIGREKTPGFGIASQFYLTVLAAKVPLPSIRQFIRPDGSEGTMVGLGAPLNLSPDKGQLDRPMERGNFVLVTKDRKTILKLSVLSKEEAHFEPAVFAQSAEASQYSEEIRQRALSTWSLLQLNFSSHHPAVYPSLDFLVGVAKRLAELTDGVIADPLSEQYSLPADFGIDRPAKVPVAARDFIRIKFARDEEGTRVFTAGFVKFALPEVEMTNIEEGSVQYAGEFLIGVAQGVLMGHVLRPGDKVGDPSCPLLVVSGGLGAEFGIGSKFLELIPEKSGTTEAAIRGWVMNLGNRKEI